MKKKAKLSLKDAKLCLKEYKRNNYYPRRFGRPNTAVPFIGGKIVIWKDKNKGYMFQIRGEARRQFPKTKIYTAIEHVALNRHRSALQNKKLKAISKITEVFRWTYSSDESKMRLIKEIMDDLNWQTKTLKRKIRKLGKPEDITMRTGVALLERNGIYDLVSVRTISPDKVV